MPSAPHRPHSSRVSGALAALCAVALGLAAPAPGAAGVDPPRITVRPSDFRSDPATTGGWLVDDVGPSNHATVTVASPQPGSGPQLLMHLENASDRAILHYRYAVNERPASSAVDDFASLRELLAGASYSFSTGTVNFQIGVFFRPVDPAFGPSGVGSAACSPATSFDTGWCFTTLKYQPFSAPSELQTVDLSATLDRGYVSSDHAGWWRSQRVGQYAKPGGPDNVSLENMLDEMSELIVYGFGVSIGTAATGDVTSWVRDFSFGGTSYGFGPDLPGPAPFASAEQLSSAAPPAAVVTSTGVDGSNSDGRRLTASSMSTRTQPRCTSEPFPWSVVACNSRQMSAASARAAILCSSLASSPPRSGLPVSAFSRWRRPETTVCFLPQRLWRWSRQAACWHVGGVVPLFRRAERAYACDCLSDSRHDEVDLVECGCLVEGEAHCRLGDCRLDAESEQHVRRLVAACRAGRAA
jgi:hypothetical protein